MRLKTYVKLVLALFFVSAGYAALAQTAPAATGPKIYAPLAIGAGFSDYDIGWNNGRMYGGTIWIDYVPDHIPGLPRGIGMEAEARDLNIKSNSRVNAQHDMREDFAGGGVIYSWPHFRNFRPYVKVLLGYGNDEYDIRLLGVLRRYHQSRTVTALGGGVEYRAFRSVWLRADYEYQYWPDFFKHNNPVKPAGSLDPNGFTFGAMYRFSAFNGH